MFIGGGDNFKPCYELTNTNNGICGYAAGRLEEKNKNHTKECNQSELSPKELEMFPYWYEADRQAGEARFGDLWCTIASGKGI